MYRAYFISQHIITLKLENEKRASVNLNGKIIPIHASSLLFPRGSDYTFTSSLTLGLYDHSIAGPDEGRRVARLEE